MKIDKRTQYDLLVEKIICVKQMFEGTYIPDIICSYLCYDFKGILNKRRFKSICGDPLYLPVTLIRLMKVIFKKSKFQTKYLTTLGSMGEHIAPSVAEWFAKHFTSKKNSEALSRKSKKYS